MRKYKTILIASIIIMMFTGFGIQSYVTSIWSSWVEYKTPLSNYKPIETMEWKSTPIGKYVIIILIDGLRPDIAEEYSSIGVYETVNKYGVKFTNAYTVTPSYSVPARAAISTGLPHELSGVSSNWYNKGVLKLPNIFSLAHNKELSTAAVGDSSINTLFGGYLDLYIEIEEDENHSTNSMEEALKLINKDNIPNLLWIGLADIDHNGHLYGAMSKQYKDSVEKTGNLILNLIDTLVRKGLYNDTLIVLISDHGHLDRGGHGGEEEIVRRIYLAFLGGSIKEGVVYNDKVYQMSVAPTIAVYLGLDPELISTGPPLYMAFKDNYQDLFSIYSQHFIKNYYDALEYLINTYGLDKDIFIERLNNIKSILGSINSDIDNKNYISALSKSVEAYSILNSVYQDIRKQIISSGALYRTILVSIIGIISVILIYLGYKRLDPLLILISFIVASLITIVFSLFFIDFFNYSLSMSAINELDDYLQAIIISMTIALMIGGISAGLIFRSRTPSEKKWFVTTYSHIAIILLVILIMGIPSLMMLIQYGYKVVFPFPNWTVGYLYYTSVLSIMFLLLFNWIIPIVTMIALYKRKT